MPHGGHGGGHGHGHGGHGHGGRRYGAFGPYGGGVVYGYPWYPDVELDVDEDVLDGDFGADDPEPPRLTDPAVRRVATALAGGLGAAVAGMLSAPGVVIAGAAAVSGFTAWKVIGRYAQNRNALDAGAEGDPNVQIGPDATTGEWTVAGHAITVAVMPSGKPGVTDVWATYDGIQIPKMTIAAEYAVARRGIQGLKRRILQAMDPGGAT